MARRKPGTLLPIELDILAAGLAAGGTDAPIYGFALAGDLAEGAGAAGSGGGSLASHGTLYKALARMTEAGLLTATWEDAEAATAEGRPRRRLYTVTGEGQAAHARALAAEVEARAQSRRARDLPGAAGRPATTP